MASGVTTDGCSSLRCLPVVIAVVALAPLALTACAAWDRSAADRSAVDLSAVNLTVLERSAAVEIAAVAPAAGGETSPGTTVAWPDPGSCAAIVRQLAGFDAARIRVLDPLTAPLVMASLGPEALAVRSDLPIPEVTAAAVGAAPCAVLVGAAVQLPAAADVVLERRTVHSAYPTGTKRRRNPEHQALEKAVAAKNRTAATGVDVFATGDPLLDLIGTVAGGVISGIGAVAGRGDVRAAEAALADTPAFIEDPILTPYRYELVELEAERRLAVPVALYDRGLGLAAETIVTLAEQRRFAVGSGRHPQDVEPQHATHATAITAAELAAWRRSPPPIATSMLLTHLAATEPAAPTGQASLEATMARLARPSPGSTADERQLARTTGGDDAPPAIPAALSAAVDGILTTPEPSAGPAAQPVAVSPTEIGAWRERPSGIVRVGADGLAGFYVTPEHVVVPAAALGRSSLIVVRYSDGMSAYGLVELVDDALGLALVYLPRSGVAMPLRPATSPAPATTSEPGLPRHDGGTVIGLFVIDPATAGPRWIDSLTLDRFVAGLDSL